MEKIFCPFTKGDCDSNCIFSNNYFEENNVENCDLRSIIRIIQSIEINKPLSEFMQEMTKKLDYIESNINNIDSTVNSNQSDISSIRYTVNEIKNLLNKD